jgi:hypothetical protein
LFILPNKKTAAFFAVDLLMVLRIQVQQHGMPIPFPAYVRDRF